MPLIVKHKNSSELVKPLEKPSKLYRILGDGNCLFRALSYAITGRQNYHSLVREKIVQHIRHKEHALLAHMNGSVNEYLARTGMTNQHVWGTDIEIIAASSLLETDIYVYTKIGFLYKWQRFSSSILSGYPAKNIGGLYLQNTSGVHYICQRCSSDKKVPKKFSAGNQMIPSCIPNELQDLTQIEEMLIARALPIMNVYVKPGGQRGFPGHCINLPQQVSELAQSLPRYPKHVSLLLVTMNGKDNAFKDVIVGRSKVQQALIWLIQNNPHYTNVTLNLDSLHSLPENGVPDDLQTVETNETEFQNIETNANTSDDSDEDHK